MSRRIERLLDPVGWRLLAALQENARAVSGPTVSGPCPPRPARARP